MTIEPLKAFVSDVVDRYPDILEIVLFGSRARGQSKPESDWDILAIFDPDPANDAQEFLTDAGLRRHFATFLDLFVLESGGEWLYPGYPEPRGFFPHSKAWRHEIQCDAKEIYTFLESSPRGENIDSAQYAIAPKL